MPNPFDKFSSLQVKPQQGPLLPGGTVGGVKFVNTDARKAEIAAEESAKNAAARNRDLTKTEPIQQGILLKDLANAPNLIQGIRDVRDTLRTLPDEQQGPILGTLTGLPGIKSYQVERSQADSNIRYASQEFGKFMEGGVLRKEDEEKYFKIYPQINELPAIQDYKAKMIERRTALKYNNDLSQLKDSGVDIRGLKFLPVLPLPTLGKARQDIQNKIDTDFNAIGASSGQATGQSPQDAILGRIDELSKRLEALKGAK